MISRFIRTAPWAIGRTAFINARCFTSKKPEHPLPSGRKTNQPKDKQRYDKAMLLLKQKIQELKQQQAQRLKQQSKKKSEEQQKKQSNSEEPSSNPYKQYFKRFLGFSVLIYVAYQLKQALMPKHEPLSFDRMLVMLQDGHINKIHIKNTVYQNHVVSEAYISTSNHSYIMPIGNVDTFKSRVEGYNNRGGFKVNVTESRQEILTAWIYRLHEYLRFALQAIIFVSILFSIKSALRSGNIQSVMPGVTNSKPFKPQINLQTRFKDVAGLNDAKLEIIEFVDFLKNSQKYKDLGARIPKGALLSGPPGTGKTMLAKACSGQAGVPFFSASGSEFVEVFAGVGASRVRQLFKAAKAKTPSIIFIDEIDAIGRKRESQGRGGNDQRANTLNQLLVEMDGFGTSADVIVLAATNRKELLDSALTRPGRFDRSIEISLPDLQGRRQIFLTHLKPLKLSSDKTIDQYAKRLATLTPGFSGADIYNICNEAAILSARQNKSSVESIDFEMATERVIGGVEKKKIITEKERRTVAYHECGHAVVSWFLEGAHPLLKLTIIPRSKGALGFAQYLPSQTFLETKQELLDKICVILGGRCSEEHFFKRITTGAQDDLQKVYKLARSIVINYGMSERIGYVSPRESQYEKDYSEEMNQVIDEQISKIAKQCTDLTRQLIIKHADKVEKLAEKLLQKETLDSRDIRAILGERPFPAKSNYKDYLEQTQSK